MRSDSSLAAWTQRFELPVIVVVESPIGIVLLAAALVFLQVSATGPTPLLRRLTGSGEEDAASAA